MAKTKTSKAEKTKSTKSNKDTKVTKAKKVTKKTVSKKAEPEPVKQEMAPVVEESTVVNTAPEETSKDDELKASVGSIFESLIEQGESINNSHKLMLQLLKKTSKSYARERRDYDKNLARERRRAKKDPNRKKREPSGFRAACKYHHGLQRHKTRARDDSTMPRALTVWKTTSLVWSLQR